MWMVFGVLAVVTAVLNVVFSLKGRESGILMFLSLSFTALTLCGQYALVEKWVINGDTNALESVVIGMPKPLYILTSASILVNSIGLFRKKQ